MQIWLIIGPAIGGGLGWLLGRRNSAAARNDCATTAVPAWGAAASPWSGAVTGAVFGFIIAAFIVGLGG